MIQPKGASGESLQIEQVNQRARWRNDLWSKKKIDRQCGYDKKEVWYINPQQSA
jgi:hypothetical protein